MKGGNFIGGWSSKWGFIVAGKEIKHIHSPDILTNHVKTLLLR